MKNEEESTSEFSSFNSQFICYICILFKSIRGNTKSKTNYTYDIDIQQIKEDRKKYEKSQCFPFASHFGLKRG